MDQQKIRDRAFRVLEIAKGMAEKLDKLHGSCSASNSIEEIQLHFNGYEEPGYSEPECGIIATGNWNSFRVWDKATNTYQLNECYLPERLRKIFEKLGIECEWSDEWTTCGECYALVRTSPDSYGWTASYVLGDGDLTCASCVLKDPEEYLKSLEDRPETACTLNVDPAKHGYRLLSEVYENGFHPGQNDDPKKIAAELREKDVSRFLFKITDKGQFDIRFVVYVHEEEYTLLNATPDDYFPEDEEPAEECDNA